MTKKTSKKNKERLPNIGAKRATLDENPDLNDTNGDANAASAVDSNAPQAETPATLASTSDNDDFFNDLFDLWDLEHVTSEEDAGVELDLPSLESAVGYSSLHRQMHQAYIRMVQYYKTPSGGNHPTDEARSLAFRACSNKEEAVKLFRELLDLPLENLNFIDLQALDLIAPRVAEKFWERAKKEGRKEFASGHLSANISFPVGYMKQVWNIARYLGVRESFIDDWKPKGGIEVSMIDMLTQAYFQWQYWLEQTVKRSETREREMDPDYSRWMQQRQDRVRSRGWTNGFWNRPFVSEQQAVEHAAQMADRWNRIYMRTLRQMRELRRYSNLTIINPKQVNIANEGGQQVNVAE